MNRFAGFTSRWTIPTSWAAARARAALATIPTARFRGTSPRSSRSASVAPSISSSAHPGAPLEALNVSKTGTIASCAMRETSWHSAANDAIARGSLRRSTLTATRPSRSWRASQTVAMPPRPSSRTIS